MASDSAYVRLALRIMSEISGIILFPAVAALVAFRVLEARNSPAWVGYSLFAVAFALTAVLLVRRARSFGRAYEQLSRAPKDHV